MDGSTRSRRLIVGAFAFVLVCGAAALLAPSTGYCVFCPTYTCFGSCGVDQCVCITAPGELGGRCYGVERAEELLAEGWVRVP